MWETFISNSMLEAWVPTWAWCLPHPSEYRVAFMSPQTITLDCQSGPTPTSNKCMVSNLSSFKHQAVDMHPNSTIRCTTRAWHLTRWTLGPTIKMFRVPLVTQEWCLLIHMDSPSKGLLRYPSGKTSTCKDSIPNNSSHNNSTINTCILRE